MTTITDLAALEALSSRSVVIDRDGDVWQLRGGLWCSYETAPVTTVRLMRKHGPVTLLSPVTHGEELEGATERPDEGHATSDAGAFAATWNALTPEQRDEWVRGRRENDETAYQCLFQDHRSLIERERVSWLSSHDLHEWADQMLDFANNWQSYEPVGVTRDDLVRAAGIAQRLAHDHVTYAVKVQVKHFERAGERAEVVVIDGRVLLDDVAVDRLMTEAGWIES